MEVFQPSELINLIASLVFLVVLLNLSISKSCIIQKNIMVGIFLFLTGNLCAVVVSFIIPELSNVNEHSSFTLGAICFFGTIRISNRNA